MKKLPNNLFSAEVGQPLWNVFHFARNVGERAAKQSSALL